MRFSKGDEVEVTWDDEGFRGAWYEARVARTMSKTRRYSVVYDHLIAGDGSDEDPHRRPLREIADFIRVRPRPPRQGGPFALHQPVDAWHNDGWWTGVVVDRSDNGERYIVCFPSPREQREFAAGDLRVHQEWADHGWVRPDENSPGQEASAFPVGTQVEVAGRRGDSLSMWVIATVEKLIWENNLLVKYESLQADAVGEFLREIVDVWHVRPCPPLVSHVGNFSIFEEVEVFHDDGWCAGIITRIQAGSKCSLKSEHWEGEMEFCLPQLRLRHEWIDGCWVQPPKKKSVRHSQRFHTTRRACKSHGSVYISISSDSHDRSTSSDTEIENGSTFEDQIGISLSSNSTKKRDTLGDDTLLLDTLNEKRPTKSAVQAGKEFATPTIRERGRSCIVGTLTVQQPSFKKQSKGIIAESPNCDGENDILVGEKLEHRSGGENCYSPSVNYEISYVHHHLKWAHKYARRPRMSSSTQKSEAGTYPRKHRWNIHHNVVEMGQDIKEKGRCGGNPTKAKVLNSENSLEGDSLGDHGYSIQLVDREGSELSHGGLLLPQLDAVVEADPSSEALAAQKLLDMTESTDTRLNENSGGDMQLVEAVRERGNEDLNTPLQSYESHRVVHEGTGVTVNVIPCSSTSKFSSPFVKSSKVWEVIEAMEVFSALPQVPHFRPVLEYCSVLREGMAIGLMVTFDNLVTNITKLQITDSESMFEGMLEMVNHLEYHGFDVQHVRHRLEKLLRMKHDLRQLEDKKATLSGLILEQQNDAQRLSNEIEMIDGSVKELEKDTINLCNRRSALVILRESKEHEIARLQIDEKAATQASLCAKGKFGITLAAAW